MFRFKNNIGPQLRARTSKRQEAEIKLGVHILNQYDTVRNVRFSKN